MTVSIVLTGTSQNITATNSSPNITVASTTGWVVGATVQGTGFAAGTKIISFVANTSAVLSNNFTGTTGTVSVIVSSNTGTLTVTLAASGDTANPQTMITAGFGTLIGNQTIQVFGACKIVLAIATGAVYDDTEWVYELGNGSSLRMNETSGCGIWRSGFKLQGSTYVKAKGHTVNYNNFDNSYGAGGRGIFFNTGVPPGYVAGSVMPSVHWNDVNWFEYTGSNAAAIGTMYYGSWSPVGLTSGRIVFDYSGDGAGANAGFSGSYGTVESVLLYRCIGSVGVGITATAIVSVGKFEYFSLPTGGGMSNPDIRMAFPNNLQFSGYAPIFYVSPASNEYVCCNTTNSEILVDYVFPAGFNVLTNTGNYSSGNRTYKRTVSFSINNSAGTTLSGVTLYIYSGSNVLLNAVQAGNFSSPLQAAFLSWAGRSGNAYIAALSTTDTRAQTAQLRLYGYVQQTVSYNLQDAAYSQPFFMLADAATSGYSAVNAALIAGVAINYVSKTVTLSANVTLDQVYSYIAYQLALTTNSAQAQFLSSSGTAATMAAGWSLITSGTAVLSSGTYVNSLNVPTITTVTALNNVALISNVSQAAPTNLTGLNLTGSLTFNTNTNTTITLTNCVITGTVSNSGTGIVTITNSGSTLGVVGANITTRLYALFSLTSLTSGSTIYLADNTSTQKDLNLSGSTSYTYDATGGTGTWTWVDELYGKQRNTGTFTPVTGVSTAAISYTTDVYITQTNKATVAAYTSISTLDQLYDYAAYMRTQQPQLSLATRNSIKVDFGSTNIVLSSSASSVWSYSGSTVTIKQSSLAVGSTFLGLSTAGSITTDTAPNNLYLFGSVIQATPTNLTGLNLTGSLTFNTNTNTTITLTNCVITGTVSNSGTGIVTITNSGSTIGVVGTNVVTQLFAPYTISSLTAGSTVLILDSTGAVKNINTNSGTSFTYDATGGTGTWSAIVELYGQQRQTTTFMPSQGAGITIAAYVPDTYITQTNKATVAAYTTISDLQQLYDYAAYMRTQQPQYNLAVRNGSAVDFGATALVFDPTAAGVWSYTPSTLTIKTTTLVPGTYFGEVYTSATTTFNNGAVLTCVYQNSAGVSTVFYFDGLLNGSAIYMADNNNNQMLFQANTTTTQVYVYIPPGATGNWTARIRKYGTQDNDTIFTPPGGYYYIGSSYTPDTQVVDTVTNVSAYTDLGTTQKIYDYSRYWATTLAGIVCPIMFSRAYGLLTANESMTFNPTATALMAYDGTTVTTKTSGLSENVTVVIPGVFTQGSSLLGTGVLIRAVNIDSELTYTNIDSIVFYSTLSDALTETSPGTTTSGGIFRFEYGATVAGVAMETTVYGAANVVGTVQILTIPLVKGSNVIDLSTTTLLQGIYSALQVVNGGVQKASLSIPHTTNF